MKSFRFNILALVSVLTVAAVGCTINVPVDASGLVKDAKGENGDEEPAIQEPGYPGPEKPDLPVESPTEVPKPIPGPGQGSGTAVEAVLESIEVKPVNGGISPEAKAFQVDAKIQLGSNSCDAQGSKASIEVVKLEDGTAHVVGKLVRADLSGIACPAIFKPVFSKVTITVRGQSKLDELVFIRHAGDFDVLRPLKDFIGEGNEGPACFQPEVCDQVFEPVLCEIQGSGPQPLKFSNICEAQNFLKKVSCAKNIPKLDAKVVCKPAP